MTKEQLQKALDEKRCKVKILHFEKYDADNYYIVYTKNLLYAPKIHPLERDYLEEEEIDILASDLEEAVEYISNPISIK